MIIYSHRGLDLDIKQKAPESSYQSVREQLAKGFSVELDLQWTSDKQALLWHDYDLKRWSQNRLSDKLESFSTQELKSMEGQYYPLLWWNQLEVLLNQYPKAHLALHIKSRHQSSEKILQLIELLDNSQIPLKQILLFDLKLEAAKKVRQELPEVLMAASVSRPEEVKKYSGLTGDTLFTPDEAFKLGAVYNWLWWDEWASAEQGLFEKEQRRFQSLGFKSAWISPELHKNENHLDGLNLERLEKRWTQILRFGIEAICTDYPTRLESLASRFTG